MGQNISNEILSLKNLEVNCIFLNISSVNPFKKKSYKSGQPMMPRKSQLEKEEVGLREGGPARQRKVKADFLKLDFLEVHICQHVPQTLSQA